MYNQQKDTWEAVIAPGGQAAGAQSSYTGDLSTPADYIDKDGAVQVRVNVGTNYYGPLALQRLGTRYRPGALSRERHVGVATLRERNKSREPVTV